MAERSPIVSYREVTVEPLKQGGTVHLFIATVRTPAGAEQEVPYMLTADPDGRVSKVE